MHWRGSLTCFILAALILVICNGHDDCFNTANDPPCELKLKARCDNKCCCGANLMCVTDPDVKKEVQYCRPKDISGTIGKGGDCSGENDLYKCDVGLTCVGGTCAEKIPEGGLCTDNPHDHPDPKPNHHNCVGEYCNATKHCAKKPKIYNEKCTNTVECPINMVCCKSGASKFCKCPGGCQHALPDDKTCPGDSTTSVVSTAKSTQPSTATTTASTVVSTATSTQQPTTIKTGAEAVEEINRKITAGGSPEVTKKILESITGLEIHQNKMTEYKTRLSAKKEQVGAESLTKEQICDIVKCVNAGNCDQETSKPEDVWKFAGPVIGVVVTAALLGVGYWIYTKKFQRKPGQPKDPEQGKRVSTDSTGSGSSKASAVSEKSTDSTNKPTDSVDSTAQPDKDSVESAVDNEDAGSGSSSDSGGTVDDNVSVDSKATVGSV